MARYDLSDPDAVSFCRACGTGYRAGPVHCVDCGEPLVSRSAIAMESLNPEGDGSWTLLADVDSPFKADVLTSALEEAGIEFIARPAGYFETAGRGALRFLVPRKDHHAASGILEELEELEQAPLEDELEGEAEAISSEPIEPIEEEARAERVAFDLADSNAVCFCPSCGAGYRSGFSRCADCDEVLVSRDQARRWAERERE